MVVNPPTNAFLNKNLSQDNISRATLTQESQCENSTTAKNKASRTKWVLRSKARRRGSGSFQGQAKLSLCFKLKKHAHSRARLSLACTSNQKSIKKWHFKVNKLTSDDIINNLNYFFSLKKATKNQNSTTCTPNEHDPRPPSHTQRDAPEGELLEPSDRNRPRVCTKV